MFAVVRMCLFYVGKRNKKKHSILSALFICENVRKILYIKMSIGLCIFTCVGTDMFYGEWGQRRVSYLHVYLSLIHI